MLARDARSSGVQPVGPASEALRDRASGLAAAAAAAAGLAGPPAPSPSAPRVPPLRTPRRRVNFACSRVYLGCSRVVWELTFANGHYKHFLRDKDVTLGCAGKTRGCIGPSNGANSECWVQNSATSDCPTRLSPEPSRSLLNQPWVL